MENVFLLRKIFGQKCKIWGKLQRSDVAILILKLTVASQGGLIV